MVKLDERLEVRVPKPVKARIEQAAALAGQSVSSFVLQSVVEKADSIFEKETRTELSLKDARIFLRALDEAAAPNARMRSAAQRLKDWEKKKR